MQKIKYAPLSELKERAGNPKEHDIGAIYESIQRFGFIAPIVIDTKTDKLVAGHGRLETLKILQKEKRKPPPNIEIDSKDEWLIPVIEVEFENETEAMAYTVADNRLVELGGWDDNLLLEALQDIHLNSNLDSVGFELEDIDDLLRRTGVTGDEKSLFLSQFLDEVGEDMSKSEYVGNDGDIVYFKLTFALTEEQRQTVLDGIKEIKKQYNTSNSTDALVIMCEQVIKERG